MPEDGLFYKVGLDHEQYDRDAENVMRSFSQIGLSAQKASEVIQSSNIDKSIDKAVSSVAGLLDKDLSNPRIVASLKSGAEGLVEVWKELKLVTSEEVQNFKEGIQKLADASEHNKIYDALKKVLPVIDLPYGKLDITFYRDDIRYELHQPNKTDILFSLEDKNVVLIDDVLFTGRTIRAAMDALLSFGRPNKVELCVLIDRRYSRQLPIQPDYCGKPIDSVFSQKVKVEWEKEEVNLY